MLHVTSLTESIAIYSTIVIEALRSLSLSASCPFLCFVGMNVHMQVSRAQPIREIVCDVMASPLPPSALTRFSISLQRRPVPATPTYPSAGAPAPIAPIAPAAPVVPPAVPPAVPAAAPAAMSPLTSAPLQQPPAATAATADRMMSETVPSAAVAGEGEGERRASDASESESERLASASAAVSAEQQGSPSRPSGPVVRYLLELFQHLPADVMEQVRGSGEWRVGGRGGRDVNGALPGLPWKLHQA